MVTALIKIKEYERVYNKILIGGIHAQNGNGIKK